MAINTILWDVDGTLLDFDLAETNALRECMDRYHVAVSDTQLMVYKRINRELWEMLERGEITKTRLGPERFRKFLEYMEHTRIDCNRLNEEYQEALSYQSIPIEGAIEICNALQQKGIRQYIVTNGTAFVQRRKIRLSGLDAYMEEVFISEELGCVKPEKAFFEQCAARIADYDPAQTIIVGDSLTSDMRGGNNAGIRCCWYNPGQQENTTEVRIDYEIRELAQIPDCLADAVDI